MNDALIIGVAIFFLADNLGTVLFYTGEALLESDFPISLPEKVDRVLRFVGMILNKVGFIANKFAVVFGCIYILKELLQLFFFIRVVKTFTIAVGEFSEYSVYCSQIVNLCYLKFCDII